MLGPHVGGPAADGRYSGRHRRTPAPVVGSERVVVGVDARDRAGRLVRRSRTGVLPTVEPCLFYSYDQDRPVASAVLRYSSTGIGATPGRNRFSSRRPSR